MTLLKALQLPTLTSGSEVHREWEKAPPIEQLRTLLRDCKLTPLDPVLTHPDELVIRCGIGLDINLHADGTWSYVAAWGA